MRKLLLLAATLLAALQALPSAASPLASCRRTAGPNGIPGNASVGGVCSAPVAVTQTGDVTIRLTPGPEFTGMLKAKVTSPGYGGVAVQGIYVGGTLVAGMDSETFTAVAAPDAAWTLTVTAGESSPNSTYLFPPLPQQATLPGVAVGEFGAEVVTAAPA